MADAIASIPPELLAAAVQDVTGVSCDLSTPQGQQQARGQAVLMMADPARSEQLLAALKMHGDEALLRDPLPEALDPVAMADEAMTGDPSWDMPPVGSPAFAAYLDGQLDPGQELDDLVIPFSMQSPPSILGFAAATAEPVSAQALKEFDLVLLDAQRRLRSAALAAQTKGWLGRKLRLVQALFNSQSDELEPLHFNSKVVNNYIVVEVQRSATRQFQLRSVASGKSMYVQVIGFKHATVDVAIESSQPELAVQRLTEVFVDAPGVGAEVIHQWRRSQATMISSAGLAPV